MARKPAGIDMERNYVTVTLCIHLSLIGPCCVMRMIGSEALEEDRVGFVSLMSLSVYGWTGEHAEIEIGGTVSSA